MPSAIEEAVLKLAREGLADEERATLFGLLMLDEKGVSRMGLLLTHVATLKPSQREGILDSLEGEFCFDCGEKLPPQDSDDEHYCPEDEDEDDDG